MKDTDSQYEIISDENALRALQAEWDDLWARAKGYHYQSFAFCWIAWEQVAKPNGRALRCVIRRDAGRLAMVWPLVTYRRLLWTYLIPLCPESADYSRVLVEEHARTATWIDDAWRIARERCGADFVHLPYLHESTELYRLASKTGPFIIQERNDSYVAKLSDESTRYDWPSFCDSLGTLHERKPGSIARRLAKKGELDAQLLDPADTQRIATTIDRMLEWKLGWSERAGKHGHWLDSVHYRNFLVEWLSSRTLATRAHLLLITLDGAPLASLVFCVDNRCASTVIASFDPAHRKLSPGLLVFEYVAKWAFDRQIDLDFGSGSERYKEFWARGNRTSVWTLQSVNSTWGRMAVLARRLPREAMARATALLGGRPRRAARLPDDARLDHPS